jgi:hypothetical protein
MVILGRLKYGAELFVNVHSFLDIEIAVGGLGDG